jgi:hypothetical protein
MEAQIQQLQNQLQAQQQLLQQQAAQLAALLQAQPQALQPGHFALTPAQACQHVVNLATPSGIKIYERIVTPLDTPFDGSPNKLTTFLSAVSDRATSCNWNANLLSISNQDAVNPRNLNLVKQHRMLSLQNVRAQAATYVGLATRTAQDSVWMYEFLRDSLTVAARTRIALQSDSYTIQGTPDGPCYLKVILLTFHVETRATNFHLRKKLHDLPRKMTELKSNISAFNQYVRETVSNLASGGEITTDLLVYLFEAYQMVEDHDFNRFIQRKKEDHDDNHEEMTPEILLLLAETKYNQLIQAKTWRTPPPEEEKFVTLTAQLKKIESDIFHLTKSTEFESDSESES